MSILGCSQKVSKNKNMGKCPATCENIWKIKRDLNLNYLQMQGERSLPFNWKWLFWYRDSIQLWQKLLESFEEWPVWQYTDALVCMCGFLSFFPTLKKAVMANNQCCFISLLHEISCWRLFIEGHTWACIDMEYLWPFNMISHEWAALTCEISHWMLNTKDIPYL